MEPAANESYSKAWSRLNSLWSETRQRDPILKGVVAILHDEIEHYDWVGIYILRKTTLHLHNQRGEPTPHEEIPVGQGICGAAIQDNDTIVVPDVKQDERYIVCSLKTASEIVVPIRVGERPVAQIDVDSDTPDAFSDMDRRFLEAIARRLTIYLAESLETLPPTDRKSLLGS